MTIGQRGAVVISGAFEGHVSIQMAKGDGGPWITVWQTKAPGKFSNVAAGLWRIRAGFVDQEYVRGSAYIDVVEFQGELR